MEKQGKEQGSVVNENIKFSVVVPVYNVQEYFKEALECLREQTYRRFEVIIVDDCATDQSGEIADRFVSDRVKEGDYRFRVIHLEKNGGVSNARNRGMQEAEGDYILFLDPDDFFERTMLETLLEATQETSWDIMLYGYTEDYFRPDGSLSYQVMKTRKRKSFEQMGEAEKPLGFCDTILELEQETMYGYPWNKAYRLSYLRRIRAAFPIITHIEDILFNIAVFEEVSSFLLLPDILYHYRNQGQERLTGKYLPQYFALQKQRILAFLEQQCRWRGVKKEDLPEQVLGEAANFYFRAFQSSMVRSIACGEPAAKAIAESERERAEPLYQLLSSHLRRRGRVAKLLYRPLAEGKVKAAYRRSFLIYFVQRYFPGLYARLKQNR